MCLFSPGDLKHSHVKIMGSSRASANYWFPDSSCILEQSSLESAQKAKELGELLAAMKDRPVPPAWSLWGADPAAA